MGVLCIRIPNTIHKKYRSLDAEAREKIYRALQGIAVAAIEGKPVDGIQPINIKVEVCKEKQGRAVKEAEIAYSYVIEALALIRRITLSGVDIGKAVKELRKLLAPLAIHVPDKEYTKILRDIQKAFTKLISIYIENRGSYNLRELEEALTKLKQYLEENYPVF